MRPKSFRSPGACCSNCKFCFYKKEYVTGSYRVYENFYCTFGDEHVRPSCGSSCLGEVWKCEEDKDAWYEWEKGRNVDRRGICDHFCYPDEEE